MKETANFGLKKPEENDFYDFETQNENMDEIDRVLQEYKDGTQQVGDSAKLGGKDASEYVTEEERFNNFNWTELEQGFDLNNALGRYSTSSAITISTLLNKPSGLSGNNEITVEWFPTDERNKYGVQMIRQASNKNMANIYIRQYQNFGSTPEEGVWSAWQELLHTGNKPTGTYTGNGDATSREISTGGIGHVLFVWSEEGNAVIMPTGGYYCNTSTGALQRLKSTEAKFANGKLILASTNSVINKNGMTVEYQVG